MHQPTTTCSSATTTCSSAHTPRGLERAQEAAVMRSIVAAAANQPLALDAMEVDEFEFNITSSEKPHIQNDTVTLHKRAAKDYRVR